MIKHIIPLCICWSTTWVSILHIQIYLKFEFCNKITPAATWLAFEQTATSFHKTVFTIYVCMWWGVWIEQTFNVTISAEIYSISKDMRFSTANYQVQNSLLNAHPEYWAINGAYSALQYIDTASKQLSI